MKNYKFIIIVTLQLVILIELFFINIAFEQPKLIDRKDKQVTTKLIKRKELKKNDIEINY